MTSVREHLPDLAAATADLLRTLDGLSDPDVRRPSLLPGWTRGHVLTHLARNAEAGTRLLAWARTGVPKYEYPSAEARAAAIEQGAWRDADVLVADVRATAAGFADAAEALPVAAWQHVVRWTNGVETGADVVVRARLDEVLVHHVDLDLGFGPASWSAGFVADKLTRVVASLNRRDLGPLAVRLIATDTGRSLSLGRPGGDPRPVSGAESDLLAWLLGRSRGAALQVPDGRLLPEIPDIH